MPEVIIEMAAGRTPEAKKKLIVAITEAFVSIDIPREAVTVILHENPLTDKAKGGVLFSER